MAYQDRLNGVSTSVAIKAPCKVQTISNITLSGLQTINSVAVIAEDRVLVLAQTDPIENGIYTVKSGVWERGLDFNSDRDVVQGTLIPVYGSSIYELTAANPIIIGSSDLTIVESNFPQLSGVTVTSYAASLLDDLNASAARDTLDVLFNSGATQAEALAGTNNTKVMTPLRTLEAIMSLIDNSSTGDAKLTYKTTADTGYVMADDGSIGSAASSATNRANADTEALYSLFWGNISDTYAPVSSGRGVSAAADFAANKTLTLPAQLGRAIAIAGAGAGLTSRALGETLGEEDHTMTETELKSHNHSGTQRNSIDIANSASPNRYSATSNTTTGTTGSSTPFNVMQPTSFLNVMIKL